jgi:xanthine dehydrogenase accessory factor
LVEVYEAILRIKKEGARGILVTVVEKQGPGPSRLQGKLLVTKDGQKVGTVGGGALEKASISTCETLLKEKKEEGYLKKYLLGANNNILDAEDTGMLCGGSVTLFYETILSGQKLYIFGAGHIGKALVYHLKQLNYHITLADCREELISQYTEEDASVRLTGDYKEIIKKETFEEGSFILIATHSHDLDYEVLKEIYKKECYFSYIGALASKKKIKTMRHRLLEELGEGLDLSNLYSPVGLDIGGRTPHDIAISIIAEMQALRNKKKEHQHMRIK